MSLQDYIGNTPLVTLQRFGAGCGSSFDIGLEDDSRAASRTRTSRARAAQRRLTRSLAGAATAILRAPHCRARPAER